MHGVSTDDVFDVIDQERADLSLPENVTAEPFEVFVTTDDGIACCGKLTDAKFVQEVQNNRTVDVESDNEQLAIVQTSASDALSMDNQLNELFCENKTLNKIEKIDSLELAIEANRNIY